MLCPSHCEKKNGFCKWILNQDPKQEENYITFWFQIFINSTERGMANIFGPEASHSLPNLQICIFQAGPLAIQWHAQSKCTWELIYNKFHLNRRKTCCSVRVTEHWKRLSRIVEFSPLEIFKSHMEKILGALWQVKLLQQWGWAGGCAQVPSSSSPPVIKGFKQLAGSGCRAPWAVGSITVFQVFIFKACGDHSAMAEVLKRLMCVLQAGKDIFFYSWNHTDCILKPLVFNISSEKF